MIITDRFVVLNNPRTGSTFVRTVLKKLHGYPTSRRRVHERILHRLGLRGDPSFTELLLPVPNAIMPIPPNQHGRYAQIPERHRNKKVVSVVRDPFSRLLSIYRFRWWQQYPLVDPDILALQFPNFPDLTFQEYLRLEDCAVQRRLSGKAADLDIGRQTLHFIRMFFRKPGDVLARLNREYLDSDRFLEDLPPIRFLQTERLNHDLHEFLRENGYAEERIAFVLEHEPLNAAKDTHREFQWSTALADSILYKERLLFRILRHLGFDYAGPLVIRDASVDQSCLAVHHTPQTQARINRGS